MLGLYFPLHCIRSLLLRPVLCLSMATTCFPGVEQGTDNLDPLEYLDHQYFLDNPDNCGARSSLSPLVNCTSDAFIPGWSDRWDAALLCGLKVIGLDFFLYRCCTRDGPLFQHTSWIWWWAPPRIVGGSDFWKFCRLWIISIRYELSTFALPSKIYIFVAVLTNI